MSSIDIAPYRAGGAYAQLDFLLAHDGTCDEAIHDQVCLMPDFAAHVLRVANAPEWGRAMKLDRLDHACILLGRGGLADVARERQSTPAFAPAMAGFDISAFMKHQATISVAAGLIAQAAELPLAAEARTAGLLHEIGLQIEIERNPEGFALALAESRRSGMRLIEHERIVMGTDHCETGEGWMQREGFPPSLTAAVAFHHDPLMAPSEHRYLTMLVYAGECLARHAGHFDMDGESAPPLESKILAELRISERTIAAYVPILRERLDALFAPQSYALTGT
jgi:HD-like signal output (HDOD) protein